MSDVRLAPAGWYPDDQIQTLERFWDGARWAEQWRPRPGVTPSDSELWWHDLVRQLRSGWRVTRWTLLAAVSGYMVYLLAVDRWPVDIWDTSPFVVFAMLTWLRPRADPAEERLFPVEAGFLLTFCAACAFRNGGWLPGTTSLLAAAAFAALARLGDPLPKSLRVPAEVALGVLVLALVMPYVMAADPSWRLL